MRFLIFELLLVVSGDYWNYKGKSIETDFIFIFMRQQLRYKWEQSDFQKSNLKNASLQNAAYLLNAHVGTSPLGVADRLVEISIFTLAPSCGIFGN